MKEITMAACCFALTACDTLGGGRPTGNLVPKPVPTTTAELYSMAAARAAVPSSGALSKHHRLLDACLNPPMPQSDKGMLALPLLAPLIMAIFNLATGEIERRLEEREKENLEKRSHTFTAKTLSDQFPLATMDDPVSCIVVSDRDNGGVSAEYALRLKRIDTSVKGVTPTAFVIEPVGGWVGNSGVLDPLESPPRINADLAVAITTITKNDGVLPDSTTFPPYGVSFKDLKVGKNCPDENGVPNTNECVYLAPKGDPRSSVVLTLPQDRNSPTSIVVSVTESDVGLQKEQERIALLQKTRQALLGALGEILKGQLGG